MMAFATYVYFPSNLAETQSIIIIIITVLLHPLSSWTSNCDYTGGTAHILGGQCMVVAQCCTRRLKFHPDWSLVTELSEQWDHVVSCSLPTRLLDNTVSPLVERRLYFSVSNGSSLVCVFNGRWQFPPVISDRMCSHIASESFLLLNEKV